MMRKRFVCVAGLGLLAGIAGCRVDVQKDANGQEKTVQVDTPFGGIHVNTDQTTAADLGLPRYPGSEEVKNDDQHKSADVHLGFGQWELRVRAVSYATRDSQDQVVAFYKKALARYGDVIACQGNSPVGAPSTTSEGLSCNEQNNGNVKIDQGGFHTGSGQYELKAGSKRHQHIVGFEEPKDGKTRFALVSLDLPIGTEQGKSD